MLEQPGSNSSVRGVDRAVVAEPLDDRGEVLGRRAAAAADDVQPELGDEPLVRVGEPVGREVVVRVTVDDRRQPGVGQAREIVRVLREVAQVLGHLHRAGRAVDARSRRGASPRAR